jgi:hypothetical protein
MAALKITWINTETRDMEYILSQDDLNRRFGNSFSGGSCYKYPPCYEKAAFTEQYTKSCRPLSSSQQPAV